LAAPPTTIYLAGALAATAASSVCLVAALRVHARWPLKYAAVAALIASALALAYLYGLFTV
jgi:hypothetical protein